MRVSGVDEALMDEPTDFEGRPSSFPYSLPYTPVGLPFCGSAIAHLSKVESSLCSGSQPLRMLLQDGRLLDLMGSAEKGILGRDLAVRAEDVEDFRLLETNRDLVGEIVFFESLPCKFA